MNNSSQYNYVELHRACSKLVDEWEKDAVTYQKQVDECRQKGLPHDQMLATAGTLKACAAALRKAQASR